MPGVSADVRTMSSTFEVEETSGKAAQETLRMESSLDDEDMNDANFGDDEVVDGADEPDWKKTRISQVQEQVKEQHHMDIDIVRTVAPCPHVQAATPRLTVPLRPPGCAASGARAAHRHQMEGGSSSGAP